MLLICGKSSQSLIFDGCYAITFREDRLANSQ